MVRFQGGIKRGQLTEICYGSLSTRESKYSFATITRDFHRMFFPYQCNSILHGIILALKNKLHSNQGIANREKQI